MTPRAEARRAFLDRAGWAGARVAPLAGDASNRAYDRVSDGTRSAVLMDAPPDRGERTDIFAELAEYLQGIGLHPPAVLAADGEAGFLLLEDLGDGLFARLCAADPNRQVPLYTAALGALRHLQAATPPALPPYGPAEMATALDVVAEWYARTPACLVDLAEPMGAALERLDWSRRVMVLRDFHAENLIWCPEADGLRRVGLLDFQDACLGHPLFDVASLLQDARRDVPDAVAKSLKSTTWTWFAPSRPEFDTALATLSAQRALRILGVFARLSLRDGKAGYVDLIPRVWGQLQTALGHPALGDLCRTVDRLLPPPTPEFLDTLRERAGTCPTR